MRIILRQSSTGSRIGCCRLASVPTGISPFAAGFCGEGAGCGDPHRKAGMPIRIAAKVDLIDRRYFEELIGPMLALPGVEFIGEIGDDQKSEFLGNAAGMLFPIAWPEPFGLAMIEAMACGTPVIAFRCASVPEIVDDGITGFIVDTEAEAAEAATRLGQLERSRVRRVFEERFTARRMAEDYLNVYRRLIAREQPLRKAV
jgi:glycosyltransferase involved in cell wall biosynthesis